LNRAEVLKVIKIVSNHYPNFVMKSEQVDAWSNYLAEHSADAALQRLHRHIATNQFPPSLADITGGTQNKATSNIEFLLGINSNPDIIDVAFTVDDPTISRNREAYLRLHIESGNTPETFDHEFWDTLASVNPEADTELKSYYDLRFAEESGDILLKDPRDMTIGELRIMIPLYSERPERYPHIKSVEELRAHLRTNNDNHIRRMPESLVNRLKERIESGALEAPKQQALLK
jgi:hypothetical protein